MISPCTYSARGTKRGGPISPAAASAMVVLPFPGGPCRKIASRALSAGPRCSSNPSESTRSLKASWRRSRGTTPSTEACCCAIGEEFQRGLEEAEGQAGVRGEVAAEHVAVEIQDLEDQIADECERQPGLLGTARLRRQGDRGGYGSRGNQSHHGRLCHRGQADMTRLCNGVI